MIAAHLSGDNDNRPLTSIRGLAASWVFIAHVAVAFYTKLPPHLASDLICGWLGVDIFFVLSGFILAQTYGRLEICDFWKFWIRRIFRLFPLNSFVFAIIAVTALAGFPLGLADWRHLPWHLLMLQSFVPGQKAGWIFVNWSVGVELICYLGFPFLMIEVAKLRTAALLPCAVFGAAFCWWSDSQVLGNFFGWPALQRGASGFVLGVLTGAVAARIPRQDPRSAAALEAVGLIGIVYGTLAGAGSLWCGAPNSLQLALVPISAAILMAGLASDSGPFARLLRAQPIYWIGRISFSIYLLHMLVINNTKHYVFLASGNAPRLRYIALWAMLSYILTLILAALTFWAIEKPGRQLGGRLIHWLITQRKTQLIRVT